MPVDPDYHGTWQDAEDVVKSIAGTILINGEPVERVGRETAAGRDLPGGTIRIERVGGAPNLDETSDNPLVEIAYFGASYAQVQSMQQAMFRAMKDAVGEEVHAGAVPDLARVEAGPIRPAWSAAGESKTIRKIENWRLSWRPALT